MEAWESPHMFLGVQRVWGNEPSHFQVNSHFGNWSPKWILESSKRNYKHQNPLFGKFLYIIRKLLKHTCLKWACITHLDIWNTSYDQKKGWELNWQFDSWALKDGNRLDFLSCRWHATYRWKPLAKGYNFAYGPHRNWRSSREVMGPQSHGNPNSGNFWTPTWESWDKKPFGCGPCGETQRILQGGRWWLPPSLGYGEYCESEVTHGLS